MTIIDNFVDLAKEHCLFLVIFLGTVGKQKVTIITRGWLTTSWFNPGIVAK